MRRESASVLHSAEVQAAREMECREIQKQPQIIPNRNEAESVSAYHIQLAAAVGFGLNEIDYLGESPAFISGRAHPHRREKHLLQALGRPVDGAFPVKDAQGGKVFFEFWQHLRSIALVVMDNEIIRPLPGDDRNRYKQFSILEIILVVLCRIADEVFEYVEERML